MEKSTHPIDSAGKGAAILSAAEVGLGSILHGFKVPFSGHFLSLNQSFLLSRAVLAAREERGARLLPAVISNVAAVLKSLAPAGKKLTPMLAISAQGVLFSFGTFVFGTGLPGLILGSVLLGTWAFIQPALIYYLIFGNTLLEAAEYFTQKTVGTAPVIDGSIVWIVTTIIGTKIFLSAGVAISAYFLPESWAGKYQDKLLRSGSHLKKTVSYQDIDLIKKGIVTRSIRTSASLALIDLLNPFFIFSISLSALFFIYVEAPIGKLIWALLRPLAAGFILYFLIRHVSFDWLIRMLERSRFQSFGRSLETALRALKETGH